MADHSMIIIFPLLFLVLVSGMVEEEMKNVESESLYEKTSTILSARSGNLTKEQISSVDQMKSKLNEDIKIIIGGRDLEDFKNNETAIEKG